jgi:hypothetical protein
LLIAALRKVLAVSVDAVQQQQQQQQQPNFFFCFVQQQHPAAAASHGDSHQPLHCA